jgi:hypothetical protein
MRRGRLQQGGAPVAAWGADMGRTRRVAALATTAAVGTMTFALAIGSSSAHTQVDPASRAIAYLEGEQSASDGAIPVGASTDTVSEEYAIGAAAAGYDPNALRHGTGPSVMAYLSTRAAAACATAGACGELIQAVAAAGLNPASFGGVDLLTTLDGFYDTATGVFGDGEAFTQSLAVQGLVAAAQPVPAAAVHHLVTAQDSDGGWDFQLIKDDPNAATDFDSSDTNSTAMVLMALNAAGSHARNPSALAWLHTQQDADGGFPYQAGFGTDPDSTALVLQALFAAAQNPSAPAWALDAHTPLANLIATQDQDGGYTFPGNPAPDPFTTAQVPPALELQAYPAHGVFATGTTPVSESQRAIAALLYLEGEQSASDGAIPVGASTDTVSEEYAIGAAAAGYDPNALRHGTGPSVMAYLSTRAAAACATAGACGELIQAVAAAGLNPASFGGVDLLTTLDGFYDTATGVFGDGEAFTQSLAVQGLVAAAQPVPAAAVHHLVTAQDSDGGWDFQLIKDDPNAATDFDSSDTNSTAMVLMALNAAGSHARNPSALAWLHTQQDADGGFPYQAGFGTDPDSTALVLQALFAAAQNPSAPAWALDAHTPLANLIATQDQDGGYTFPGNPAPDPFTTAQVPPALERTGFPVACGAAPCFQPGTALEGTPSTPTPRPPTPTPTRRPSPVPTTTPALPASSVSPAPTSGVQGVTATPIPEPTASPPTPTPGSSSAPVALPGSLPVDAPGFPAALVYLLAAVAAALVVAVIALGARRLRGA